MDSFEAFVGRHTGDLLKTAYLLTGSQPAAEDLVHDALLKTHIKWVLVSRSQQPFAYVRRIMLNKFLSERRRKQAVSVSEADLDRIGDDADPMGQVVDREDLRRALQQRPADRRRRPNSGAGEGRCPSREPRQPHKQD